MSGLPVISCHRAFPMQGYASHHGQSIPPAQEHLLLQAGTAGFEQFGEPLHLGVAASAQPRQDLRLTGEQGGLAEPA